MIVYDNKEEVKSNNIKLIMFSGGLDSTYILWYYLTKTNYNVHVHHIILKNTLSDRWKNEKLAVNRIIKYCKNNYRPFTYSESGFDFFNFSIVTWDVDVAGFVGTMVARNLVLYRNNKPIENKIDICIGTCKDDEIKLRRQLGILNGIVRNATLLEPNISPVVERVANNTSKKEMLELLPRGLSDLTWSCRSPRNNTPCNKCKPCKIINKAKKELGWKKEIK